MAKASSYFQQVRQSTHDEPKAPTGTTCVTVFRAPRFLTGRFNRATPEQLDRAARQFACELVGEQQLHTYALRANAANVWFLQTVEA